ncbi:P-loop containing nucleoside triphosphate hydrolase protein [Vararia minispora EC-137]|uniref:P-loop containing nucleoside triphosphate hydrolase protein n=1 Tax=Vararia minispora EC-137 TaxID=1314806 RepID=A0ACB8QR21_9AGAM|nr:P-loop containing nucleoside triphosphate hydrolase protein [Vararia minispora EC-137]
MEVIAKELAEYLVHEKFKEAQADDDSRFLVGIIGIPASGKSTLAALVTSKVNELFVASRLPYSSILVGLDGWHLTRSQLDAMDNPNLAHDRRGIHWTFDADGYVSFVSSLRTPISQLPSGASVITAPSFDHALKDPIPHAVHITPKHRIVIIEGLYAFLSIEPWCKAGSLLNERWYIEIDPEKAARRLIRRHVATGVAKDLTEAQWRSDENDMPNGRFIISHMLQPTRIISSQDDPTITLE